jgi:hypothetical protein
MGVIQHAGFHPQPDLPVDALPGHPHQIAQFLLGQFETDGDALGGEFSVLLTQVDKNAGQARRQVQETEVPHHVVGGAESLRQGGQKLERHLGVAFQEGQEIPSPQDQESAILHGGDRGAARLAVEQGHLAEHVARLQDAEDRLLAIRGDEADLDPPLHDDQQVIPGLALLEHHMPGGVVDHPRQLHEAGRFLVVQGREDHASLA